MPKKKKKTGRGRGRPKGAKSMLATFGDNWDADRNEAASSAVGELDDGRYILQVKGMEFKTSSNDNFGLNTKFSVKTGDHKGATVYRWDNIDEERGLQNVARHLGVYGHDLDEVDVDDLPELCESIVKDAPTVIADLVTKNDYQNVNVKKLADVEDNDVEADDEVDDEDEVVIFDKKDEVEAKIGRKWEAGTVVSYSDDDDEYVVKIGKKKHTVDAEKVRAAAEDDDEDDDEESEVLEKGQKVEFQAKVDKDKRAKKHTGVVKSCTDDGVCKIKVDGSKKAMELPVDSLKVLESEADEDEDEDDDDRSPVKGDIVIVEIKGKEKEGEVVTSSKKKQSCVVKVGKKEHTVDWDDVEVQYDDEDDED